MDIPQKITVGIALLIGASVLTYFLYAALRAPGKMRLGVANGLPDSWGGRAYLALVVIAWLAFFYSGAYGLLYWLLGKDAGAIASLVAVLSLALLTYIDRTAYELHNYHRTLKVFDGLQRLVAYSSITRQGTIDDFAKKALTADTVADREAFSHLALLATALAERDNKLWDYAVTQTERVVADRAAAKAKAERAAKNQGPWREL